MQSSSMNVLLALGAGSSNASASGSSVTADDAGEGNAFSGLLSDFGAEGDAEGQLSQFAGGKLLQSNALAALAAQEAGQGAGASPEDISGLTISPEQANQLIPKLDQLIGQGGTKTVSVAVLQQLKSQMQQLAQASEPQPIAAVLGQLAALDGSDVVAKGQVLALIKSHKYDQHDMSEHGESPDVAALWQNVQASMFRADRRENSATAAAARQAAKADRIAGLEEKLASRASMDADWDARMKLLDEHQATLAALADGESGDALQPPSGDSVTNADMSGVISIVQPLAASVVMPVSQLGMTAVRPDLDDAIPPLTSGTDEHADALPQVELPKFSGLASTAAQGKAAARAAGTDTGDAPSAAGAPTDGQAPVGAGSFADHLGQASAKAGQGADVMSQLGLHGAQPAAHSSAGHHVNLVETPGLVNRAPVNEQVHVAIRQASKEGIDHITIQLDPIDLGRVEVNMHTSRDGLTQIHFMVDKPETFDSLSRDARTLERALQEAGIKADTGSMQFNLRQQPNQQQQQLQADVNGQGQQQNQQPSQPGNDQHVANGVTLPIAANTNYYTLNIREGVDISA